MSRRVELLAVLAGLAFVPSAHASPLTHKAARAAIQPFYDALNAAPGKDPAPLMSKATSPAWVSCSDNGTTCAPREKVIGAVAGFYKAIPDLKWEIQEVLVSGNRVIVRGEASGTPAGPFMGAPHGGKSFKIMSIDIHTIENGKMTRSYHVEDWMSAVRQLTAK